MASGDIYELIDRSVLFGQECLNVFFYKVEPLGGAATAQDLIDSYIDQVLPELRLTQTPDVLHTELSARNLFNASDRAVNAISLPGTSASTDTQNNFSAVGFSLIQDNGAIKNGSKRFAGVPDEVTVDGVITNAPFIGYLNLLGAALFDPLEWGIISAFLPVVVKRIEEGIGEYRLPNTIGEAIAGVITDAVFSPVVTSQTSRKIGVGV